MTHTNPSGFRITRRASRLGNVSLAGMCAALLLAAAWGMAGCAGPVRLESPACETMRAQVKEKQKLDAEVKAVAKAVRDHRKQGDTTAAMAAERRLDDLRETQRLLKDALDNTSRDCSPVFKDQEPVLDPALRERHRVEGR